MSRKKSFLVMLQKSSRLASLQSRQMDIKIDSDKVDWVDLSNHKLQLLYVIEEAEKNSASDRIDALQAILHFLDYIQDQAAEVLGEKAVFPNL